MSSPVPATWPEMKLSYDLITNMYKILAHLDFDGMIRSLRTAEAVAPFMRDAIPEGSRNIADQLVAVQAAQTFVTTMRSLT